MAEHHAGPMTSEEATRDLLARLGRGGGAYWPAIQVLAALAVVGLVALVILVASGPQPYSKWGYAAAVLAFLLSTAQAAPALAFATRLAKGYWGVPLRRVAELLGLSGLVTTPLFIILLFQLPDWHGRPSIWSDWPGAPHLWDSIFIVVLSLTGLALLYLGSLPDFAAARDAGNRLAGRLALAWRGTIRQWQVLSGGIVVLGAFYLMVLTFVHVFIISDLAISLVPGWKSAVIPPYHGVSALQAGVATTLVTLFLVRRLGGLERYISVDPFWGAAKLLLGLSLMFFYFTWSELITTWYGRLPEEPLILGLFMFGPYLPLFVLSFCLNFVLPFLLLIWNPIRVSISGPAFVGALVLVGNFIDRIRIYVASWSVAGPVGAHLEHLPDPVLPGVLDLLILVGAPAAVALLFLLGLRLVPPISLWEHKSALLLAVEEPYLRAEVRVVAKPR